MKSLCKPSMPCLWSRLLLLLLFILPMLLSGQNTDAIKRLNKFVKHYVYIGEGEHSWGVDSYDYNYDGFNRFHINSYRNHGSIYYEATPTESWGETYDFAGYDEYNQDSFRYLMPTLNYPYDGCIRYCVMDYNGYVLEEHYSNQLQPSEYLVSIIYEYNQEMKLIGKMRSQSNPIMYWKTDYTLDALGRRTEEITYKSADSLSWQPSSRIQYSYSGEIWDPPLQFEKYNAYLPDMSYYKPMSEWGNYDQTDMRYQPFYMNDNWKLNSIVFSIDDYQYWYPYNGGNIYVNEEDNKITVLTPELKWYWWTLEGVPLRVSGEDEDIWINEFSFNSPSANNDEVNQVPPAISISSYPNPNNGESSLQIKAEKQQPVSVITYNLRGQKLKEEVLPASANGNIAHAWKAIDGQGNPLPKGIYLIKAVSGKQSAVVRVTSLK